MSVVCAASLDEVIPCLAQTEARVRSEGLSAAGFISYEAAPAFDTALRVRAAGSFPFAWFGLFEEADKQEVGASSGGIERPPLWEPSVTREEYRREIARIRDRIAVGDTYQVNYTYRLHAAFPDDPWDLFVHLLRDQRTGYGAYLDIGDWAICSASPELFFSLAGGTLVGEPMKGTAPRGRTLAEDGELAEWLHHSEKNRAENLMIVDMIRNDIGRIAEIGSVTVPRLFEVKRFPTIHQMTSTVVGRTDASLSRIMSALFPCASITGAPKASTMDIIAAAESTPRGLYTGCIGFIVPDHDREGIRAQFNVAIRTATVDRGAGRAEYGVGGGILWESDAEDEFRESELKARILSPWPPAFELLEALLWRPQGGFYLLDRHLKRLRDSAAYFDFPYKEEQILSALSARAAGLGPEPHKVRLVLTRRGECAVTAEPLSAIPRPAVQRVRLAATPVDSRDVFLFHKTSRRDVYDRARAAAPGFDDVILWNERGEVTESCAANVAVETDGMLFTPPVASGLLAGVFRELVIAEGTVVERVIRTEELRAASRVILMSSVRAWMDCALAEA